MTGIRRHFFSRLTIATAVCGLVACMPSLVTAGTVTSFTDRSAFLAATSSTTNVDFEGLAAPGSYNTYYAGVTSGGVNIHATPGDAVYVIDPAFNPSFYDWGSGAVFQGSPGHATIASLPVGISAVGTDLMSVLNYGSAFLVSYTLSDSTIGSLTVSGTAYPTRGFFGLTSDVTISSLSLTAQTGFPLIDNFVFGTASATAVPEPSTLIPASFAALAIAGAAIRRRAMA